MKSLSERQHDDAAFRTFEDLEVYKKARDFRKRMYAVARGLPHFEKYELGRQIRRASVSLTNNIAKGHGRYHYLDEIKFELQTCGFGKGRLSAMWIDFATPYWSLCQLPLGGGIRSW